MSEPFGPADPYKQARKAGGMTMTAVLAAMALQRGDTAHALSILREGLDLYDRDWSSYLDERMAA